MIENNMKSSLRRIIENTVSISESDIVFMLSLFEPISLNKGDFFLEAGRQCDKIAFIESGMLRIFYLNDKGAETTCYFSLPNEFLTSFASFNTNTTSAENIQAILPTHIFAISKKNLTMLYQNIPVTQEFGRKAAENVTVSMEKRLSLFMNNSAEERYHFLIKHNPVLIRTVPLQYLASYIGISPQHLSRLRKNAIFS